MDKNTKIKDLETLLQESRVEEEIQAILEELEANDAPEAIKVGEPEEIEGDASREEYMTNEQETDDVEEVVVEAEELGVNDAPEAVKDEEPEEIEGDASREEYMTDEQKADDVEEVVVEAEELDVNDAPEAIEDEEPEEKSAEADEEDYLTDEQEADDVEEVVVEAEELGVNDAPEAIKDEKPEEKSAEADEEDYLTDEQEADDVKEVVVESLSDFELMKLLEYFGYDTTIENVEILREDEELLNEFLGIGYGASGKRQAQRMVAQGDLDRRINRLKKKDPKKHAREIKKLENRKNDNQKKIEKYEDKFENTYGNKRRELALKGMEKVIGKDTQKAAEAEKQRQRLTDIQTQNVENTKLRNKYNLGIGQTATNQPLNNSADFSDFELMKLLEYFGYDTTIENVEILREDEELFLKLYEDAINQNPEEKEAKEEGFKDGVVEEHECEFVNGVCKICGLKEEDKENKDEKIDDKAIQESFENIFNILTEEYAMNDAPKAIKNSNPVSDSAKVEKDDLMVDEDEYDDVEQVLIESLSDYEIMLALNECGFEPTFENVNIIRENGKSDSESSESSDNKSPDSEQEKKPTDKEKRRKEIASAVGKIALASALAGGAALMAGKDGAVEAATVNKAKDNLAVKTGELDVAKAAADEANKAVEVAKYGETVDSKLLRAQDSANKVAAEKQAEVNVAKNTLKSTQKAAVAKQIAKVGSTAGGAAVLSVSGARDLKGRNKRLKEQVALTIASENEDRLFIEMVNATVLANRLRQNLLEKYADISAERVKSILEELGINDAPEAIKTTEETEVKANFNKEDYLFDEVVADDVKEVVIEAYIPTNMIFDMLEEYGFGSTEYNVEVIREELEVNDSPVVIKIKHVDEIQAKASRTDYLSDEVVADDVKEILIEAGILEDEELGVNDAPEAIKDEKPEEKSAEVNEEDYLADEQEADDVKEVVVESVINYALNTIREIIKSCC